MSFQRTTEHDAIWAQSLKKPLVYVSGPITLGPLMKNIRRALDAAEELSNLGFVPIVPQFSCFWDLVHQEHDHRFWLGMDIAIVAKCDYLLRLDGESRGADEEVAFARSRSIPFFYTVGELVAYVRNYGWDC